jgi:hypothetical protein
MNCRMNPRESNCNDPIIGTRLFTDGVTREVYQALDGRQYVVEQDDLIRGAFLDPDKPVNNVSVIADSPSSGE